MHPLLRAIALVLTLSTFALAEDKAQDEDFAIRDKDTVVFLGDSITAARQYGKIVEDYTLLRFPDRQVTFINAGKGGETAQGCLARLDRDVFDQGATLLTVAYGINDIAWGFKADAAHQQDYLDAIAQIIHRCHARHVRVFICSAAITAEPPDKAETSFLQTMCDQGLALAQSKGAGTIDVQRSLRAVQRRVLQANDKLADTSKHTRMHVADGVHLNELGQLAMAVAILKGLHAPAEVSAATLDARTATVLDARRCQITALQPQPGGLRFTRLDQGLPLNLEPLWTLQGQFIPFAEELNRYTLAIEHLPPARYQVLAGHRLLGTWSAADLAQGINIASATANGWEPGGPWDAQAHALKVLTDMRNELVLTRRGINNYLADHPAQPSLLDRTHALEHSLVDLQHALVQPVPVVFEVKQEK